MVHMFPEPFNSSTQASIDSRCNELFEHDTHDSACALWEMLAGAHHDLNVLARKNAVAFISESQIKMLNVLLQEIAVLVSGHGYGANLSLLLTDRRYTYADVLMIVGQYKGALRAYRINVLGESQYKF